MAETATQSGLAAMASSMPVRNKTVSDQQKAARMLQLQQTVAAMTPQQAPTTAQTAQMGASLAATAGQQQVEQAKKQVQQAGQLASLGQGEAQLAGAERIGALTEGARKESLDQTQRLANLDMKAKQELFDRQLQFSKDEADRTSFTERQLIDWAAKNAQKNEDFANWKQKSDQIHARNIKILEMTDARLSQALEQGYLSNKQKLDQASRQEIAQLQQATRRRLAEAKAKAANTSLAWSAAGSLMTIAGGAAIATGLGAPVGVGLTAGGAALSGYGQQEAARQAGEV